MNLNYSARMGECQREPPVCSGPDKNNPQNRAVVVWFTCGGENVAFAAIGADARVDR